MKQVWREDKGLGILNVVEGSKELTGPESPEFDCVIVGCAGEESTVK
jgi:hypothetical protein